MPVSPIDLAQRRLLAQRLLGPGCAAPEDVVQWLGAVQAQDYAAAKWALALRTRACSDSDVERALDRGAILRTHVLRPTWHFVRPEDVRWMLELTAPRIRAALAYYDRKLEIDAKVLRRSRAVLVKALRDGKQLTRAELGRKLNAAGVPATGQRLGHLMMHAELDALVCNGARRGKQHSYALLDERVPPARALTRDEALAALGLRYFTSHGPATTADFAWWSGLTVRDAQRGVELVSSELAREVIDGQVYWSAPPSKPARARQAVLHLLPNYDEYLIAYADRSASLDAAARAALGARDSVFANHVLRNGQVIGTWRRTLEKGAAAIETTLLTRLARPEQRALGAALERYGTFAVPPIRRV
jgi:hypothetical protein